MPVPRSINIAVAGLGLSVLGLLMQAIGYSTSTTWLHGQLVKAYKDSTNKPSQTLAQYVHDQSSSIPHSVWIQNGLISAVLLLLAYSLRRTRSASGSRWALLVVFVLTYMPFNLLRLSGGAPKVLEIGYIAAGVGSVIAIVYVFFIKRSQLYFRECRLAVNPNLANAPAPGLGSLFTRRGRDQARQQALAAQQAKVASKAATTGAPPTSLTKTNGSATRAKAKVRADSEAIAKGAELARSRAKANKSRRTE